MILLLILTITGLSIMVLALISSFFIFFGVVFTLDKTLDHRCDGYPYIHYFSAEDFLGLQARPISFKSRENKTLYGFVYSYNNIKPKGLIIFLHGIGSGHLAYIKLIARLARGGYLVLAYDYTGCGLSEGNSMLNMVHGISDLNCALTYVENDELLKTMPHYVVGHSWGGFLALNSLNLKKHRVDKVVSLAGFNTQTSVVSSLKKKRDYILMPFAFLHAFFHNGKYALYSSKKALKNTKAKVLYIGGSEDKTVKRKYAGDIFLKASKKNPNVKIEIMDGKQHNCYLTARAQEYQTFLIKKYNVFHSSILDGYKVDFDLMTELDEDLIQRIISFIN